MLGWGWGGVQSLDKFVRPSTPGEGCSRRPDNSSEEGAGGLRGEGEGKMVYRNEGRREGGEGRDKNRKHVNGKAKEVIRAEIVEAALPSLSTFFPLVEGGSQ